MISPYVRRRRLAAEIVQLRDEHRCSAEQLAKRIGVARQRISRLENGHVRPSLDETMKILETFAVADKRWHKIMTIAREAQERGWWETYGQDMGARQSLYANLEAGASTIREYHQSFVPALLQTAEFVQARLDVDRAAGPLTFDPERAIAARERRQHLLRRYNGPVYEAIIDEVVLRRAPVPPAVMSAQLRHLIAVADEYTRLVVRILPVDARVSGYRMPRSSFSLYTYPDPEDPHVAVVDTITSDLVLSDGEEVRPYRELYDRLRDASLPPAETRKLIQHCAHQLDLTEGNTHDRALL